MQHTSTSAADWTPRQLVRVLARMSQDELALRLGTRDKSQISRWERNLIEFTRAEVDSIAQILQVTVDQLIVVDEPAPETAPAAAAGAR